MKHTDGFVRLTLVPTAALSTDTGLFLVSISDVTVSFSLSSLLRRFGQFCVGLVEMFGRWGFEKHECRRWFLLSGCSLFDCPGALWVVGEGQ